MVEGTFGVLVENYGRLAVRGSLAEADITLDHGMEDHITEVLANLVHNLVCVAESGVVHSKEETLNRELRVESVLDDHDSVEEFCDAVESEVLALDRDYDRVGGCEAVDSDESEGRSTVDDYIVVGVADWSESLKHFFLAVLEFEHFEFHTYEVYMRRNDREVSEFSLLACIDSLYLADETFIDSTVEPLDADSEAC